MLPRILLLALSLTSVVAAPLGAVAGKAAKKEAKEAAAEAAKPKAPAKPIEPAAAVPMVSPLNAIWHVWKDNQGRTVEAMFCGLSGEFITLQTKDGKTFHFNGNVLCAEDIAFAKSRVTKMRESAFSGGSVAKAAADIDRIVESVLAAKDQKPNAPASDEQFLRRIYVDAVGRVPTAAEATAFLDDRSADKRSKLIDKLVYSPGYSLQMFDWMADLLRVKDTFYKGVPAFSFEDWLKSRITANAPWDVMVREMLTADGRLSDNGAAGFLLYDAEMPLDGVSNLLTTFLGSNMACAQCHDHPLADWTQRDFYQMAAFFGATDGKDEALINQIKRAVGKHGPVPIKDARRIADFNAFRLEDTANQKLTFPKDYKYKDAKPNSPVAPVLIAWEKSDRALPAYDVDVSKPTQLRDNFAQWMTSTQNPRFATNIANRIWKKAFGLGVIEPVNDIDDLTEASSPELMAHLTFVMKAAKFDLREVQRVIYNSKTYQASASATPDLGKAKYLFNGPLVRRLSAEQVWDSLIVTAVGTYADNVLLRRGDDLKAMALPAGKVTLAEIKNAVERTKKEFAGSGTQKNKKAAGGSALGLANGYEGDKPISRFSMMLARASELPQPSPETHFLRLWGQGDRLLADSATNDGSVPQVLQMMNGSVGKLVSDTRSAAVMDAMKVKTTDGEITSLYLSYLSRKPTNKELIAASKSLKDGLALTDLAWVLANTREFLFVQ